MKIKNKERIKGLKISDTYDYYKSVVPKEKRIGNVKKYYSTVKKFIEYMSDKLITIGFVKIPASLGVLQIMGSDIKIYIDKKTGKIKGNVDWYSTKKLWEECEECNKNKQLVFFTNDNTGFKIYKTFWFTKTNPIVNKSLYKFKSNRMFKKRLSEHINKGDFSYMYRQKTLKK